MNKLLASMGQFIKRAFTNYGPESDYWYYPVYRDTASGVAIEESNALTCADVFKCVRVISETAASIPLLLYRRLESGGKERAEDHYLFWVLKNEPNPLMTSMNYRECVLNHLLTWGNHYSQIQRNGFGKVVALWPLRPDRMQVKLDPDDPAELVYHYRPSDGSLVIIPGEEVLHIAGLGFNGIIGYSPISLHRETIGLNMAAAEFAARFFGNDATPGGVLEHPAKLSPTAHDNLKKSVQENYGGVKNKWKFMILEEGMKWNTLTVPMKDAQFVDLRKYSRTDICGIYRVPPHMIGDLERATFSNIEQQSLDFVTNTIRPWCVRIEQTLDKKLLGPIERGRYFTEHLLEGLLRGDIQSRYAAYAIGRNWGWLSADDIRALENMNPLPDGQGQMYLVPMNMVSAENAGEPPEVQKPKPKNGDFIDVEEEEDDEEEQKLIEEKSSSEMRRKLMLSFRRLFEDGTARIIRREIVAVKKALNRPDYESFNREIDDFYRELPGFIVNTMSPIVASFNELSNGNDGAEFLNRFINEHIRESRSEIQGWVGSLIKKERFEANEEAVHIKLDNWIEDRPPKEVETFYRYSEGSSAIDKSRFKEE